MLSGRGLCDELITRPEESYRLWRVVVYDLETSRIGAPYIYDISNLRVNDLLDEGSSQHSFLYSLCLCTESRDVPGICVNKVGSAVVETSTACPVFH